MDVDTVTIEVGDDDPQLSDIPDTHFVFLDTLVFSLDEFVADCDHRPDQLAWAVSGNVNLQVTIGQGHRASICSPSGWTGAELVTFEVTDPDMHVASDGALITVLPLNDVSEDPGLGSPPDAFALFQNYPNPFNSSTTISYSIPVQSERLKVQGRNSFNFEPSTLNITLKVYNILGQEVATLVDRPTEPGCYTVTWDASGQPSGAYYAQLKAGPLVRTVPMVFLQ